MKFGRLKPLIFKCCAFNVEYLETWNVCELEIDLTSNIPIHVRP